MFHRRIFTILLLCLIPGGQILAQTQPTPEAKESDVSEELQEKARGLLNSLSREADQFYVPENRVKARVLVAKLLWETNEKQARQLFESAVSELDGMIGQILLNNSDEDELYMSVYGIGTLRSELLLEIAARDPNFALTAFQTLSRKQPDGASLFEDDEGLELQIAAAIAQNDPQQSYQLAVKSLEEGFNYTLFETLGDLHKKDPDLGAKLAREILKKIKSNAPRGAPAGVLAANTPANSAAADDPSAINAWQIRQFLIKVIELNKNAVKDKKTSVLTQDEYRDLLEILAQQYIRQPYLSPYEVSNVIGEIEKYFPPLAQALRAKFPQNADILQELTRTQEFQSEIEGKSTGEIIALIEKKPADQRDALYLSAAETAYGEGKIIGAKDLYKRVKTKPEYDYLGSQIEVDLPLALAEEGNSEEIRQRLSEVKKPSERIELLTTLARSVLAKGDRKTADELTREAASIFAGRMKNRQDLTSLLQLSQIFAVLEPERSFSFLENNMSSVNNVIAAGILIDEFNESGSVKSDEVLLEIVEGESYRNVNTGVALIKNLARADFDRTVALADRFARSEVRFFARFRIAEALLDAAAEEREKKNREMYQEEYYDH